MTYNIAFLTYDWDTEVTVQYTQGLSCFLADHPEVKVHIFSGFGGYKADGQYHAALQIFNLPYLANYDGVILQGNRVWAPSDRKKIIERAELNEIPIITLNYPLENAVTVGSDNYASAYAMAEHLIVDHHCRTIAVIAGLAASEEAGDRKRGVLDCCRKYGIENVKVYGNEWEEKYGEEAARQMIAEGNIPEGVVCGNDNLAFGAELEFIKHGYRIPEDIKISGYDNLDYASVAPVPIASVDRNYSTIIYQALDTMMALLNHQKVESFIHVPETLVFNESCGCHVGPNPFPLREKHLKMKTAVDAFYQLYTSLTAEMDKAKSLSDVVDAVEKNTEVFTTGSVYLVLNGLYIENFNNTGPVRHYGSTMVLMGASDPRDLECDDDHVYETFPRQMLLPEKILEKNQYLKVFSLQSQDTCIGYIALNDQNVKIDFNFIEMTMSLVNNAIERIRRGRVMESLNGRLSMLYITDPLTGLYNRFGLDQIGKTKYDQWMNENKTGYICFVDIDNLKKINDQFGHESGDDAILKMAQLIGRVNQAYHAFGMRYGGDEFVMISEQSMIGALKDALQEMAEEMTDAPYKLSASAGEFAVSRHNAMTLQEAIERADDIMYETKKRKKEQACK